MDVLSFYTWIYSRLRCKRMPFWLLTPMRRLIRSLANKQIPLFFTRKDAGNNHTNIEKGVIVSFTSFPARINNVWKVVECLKRQTVLPEKIILWLSKDQFPDEDSIPRSLRNQEDDLFEIQMVEGDIRSHKKYYYMLIHYPEKAFITCDDDVFYDTNMIKRLMEAGKMHPHCIIANHTARIKFGESGDVLPYIHFDSYNQPFASDNLLQIGVGGVLYPPYCLNEMANKQDLFMRLTPMADDIWLNAMARLNKTPVVQSSKDPLTLPIIDRAPSLSEVNNGEKKNDDQIQNIRSYMVSHGEPDVFTASWDVRCD